ncbi:MULTISPECIES: hypothetical protein [Arthrobacter]|uniref:hypothetical protein n=1 Tax=Arthrobacter TaxID=1663 RepID=UPI0011172D61|nr:MULTISPECIES: hypothetical protein [Arthrobacter]MDQ0210556.1 putative membrane protein SpoIIM required for sporulation [Arthrobacter bambusae]MDQ0235228.1 putative membrane protein SpoIIM required for sporulation [Arthrobacter bambusae]
MSVRNGDKPLLLVAMMLSLALMLAGFTIGFQTDMAAQSESPQPMSPEAGLTWLSALGRILAANVPALCLLFSGVITGGVSTLIAWPLTAIYIGSTMRLGRTHMGIGEVVASIWIYAPIEFLGLLLGAGAGLIPVAAAIRSALSASEAAGPLRQYLAMFPLALKIFGIASVLVLAAALLEATVLVTKGFSP